ncbi:serine hydrolase domain-containing protein [Hyalangium versicolor]|uniref:serine hydrolase domain-containing protein n=1 Tax=Hyalangium versicolor TaxID=2861190 RepID=UPI001CCB3CDF|nr:serine hydrolase domain-containing protein [Hyalangium versicolor]
MHLSLAGWLVFASGLSACKDDSEPKDPEINGCADLQQLQRQHRLEAHKRYQGSNGFTFEAYQLTQGGDEEVARCFALEQQLSQLQQTGIPGVTVYWRSPRLAFSKSQGLADKGAGVPLRPDTLIRTGSVAKSYVGALATVLALEGKVDLDNTDGHHALADYLPETQGKIQYADRITVRQLLTHTSGVPDYFAEPWVRFFLDHYHRGLPVSEDDALALVYGQPADFEPGTSAAYSNTGYVLTARILSRLLGHDYSQELRARFYEPLGLVDTYIEKKDSLDVNRLSHGYRDASPLGETFEDWFAVDQGYGFANGGVVSRVEEMGTFFRALVGEEHPLPGVDMAAFRALYLPPGPDGYGLGIMSMGGCSGHQGTFTGYVSFAAHCPASDLTAVVFGNSTEPDHETAVGQWGQALLSEDF